jgi:hypothetical protein
MNDDYCPFKALVLGSSPSQPKDFAFREISVRRRRSICYPHKDERAMRLIGIIAGTPKVYKASAQGGASAQPWVHNKNVSALKERQISASDEPAMERKNRDCELRDRNASPGRASHSLPIRSRAIRSPATPVSQDGWLAEIVFQHFAEIATLCRL